MILMCKARKKRRAVEFTDEGLALKDAGLGTAELLIRVPLLASASSSVKVGSRTFPRLFSFAGTHKSAENFFPFLTAEQFLLTQHAWDYDEEVDLKRLMSEIHFKLIFLPSY